MQGVRGWLVAKCRQRRGESARWRRQRRRKIGGRRYWFSVRHTHSDDDEWVEHGHGCTSDGLLLLVLGADEATSARRCRRGDVSFVVVAPDKKCICTLSETSTPNVTAPSFRSRGWAKCPTNCPRYVPAPPKYQSRFFAGGFCTFIYLAWVGLAVVWRGQLARCRAGSHALHECTHFLTCEWQTETKSLTFCATLGKGVH